MEETGVLVNLALLGLVLPDFEPGRYSVRLCATRRRCSCRAWPVLTNTNKPRLHSRPTNCYVIILASWCLRVEVLFESGLQREETKERGVVGRRSGGHRSPRHGCPSGGILVGAESRARDDVGTWKAYSRVGKGSGR
jgi:hypothetical protein